MASPESTIERGEEVLPVSEGDLVEGLEVPFNTRGVGEAFERLVLQMKDKLADYDIIISDDASARLVTLTMRGVINKKRTEAGKKSAPALFIAGGIETGNKGEIAEVLRKKDIRGKALLVTEFIDSGKSITWLSDTLKKLDIDFDIAALSSIDHPKKETSEFRSQWPEGLRGIAEEGRLYCGEIGGVGANFYAKDQISGITKDKHSKNPHPRKSLIADHDKVVRSRQDSSVLANRLYEIIKAQPD